VSESRACLTWQPFTCYSLVVLDRQTECARPPTPSQPAHAAAGHDNYQALLSSTHMMNSHLTVSDVIDFLCLCRRPCVYVMLYAQHHQPQQPICPQAAQLVTVLFEKLTWTKLHIDLRRSHLPSVSSTYSNTVVSHTACCSSPLTSVLLNVTEWPMHIIEGRIVSTAAGALPSQPPTVCDRSTTRSAVS
jgi:hypothetical protein